MSVEPLRRNWYEGTADAAYLYALKPLLVKPKIIAFGRGMPCQTALLAITLTAVVTVAYRVVRMTFLAAVFSGVTPITGSN